MRDKVSDLILTRFTGIANRIAPGTKTPGSLELAFDSPARDRVRWPNDRKLRKRRIFPLET